MAEVGHSPFALVNWPWPPAADVHNPVIKMALHVQIHTVHVELQWCAILQQSLLLLLMAMDAKNV